MVFCQNYLQPKNIEEAINYLPTISGTSAIIAGGTDLLLDIQQNRHPQVDTLVDISGVAEMKSIEESDGYIYLGAAVTHRQIITNTLMQKNAECVVEGCELIGGPQVRNVATIGGNVAHALPAGDGTISLLAMDSEVEIASPNGNRWEPLIGIFTGPGRVTFNRKKEILVRFRFAQKREREGSAFFRIMRPQGVAIAILNMAAWTRIDEIGRLTDIRIACGPAGPIPFRATQTETFLKNKSFEETVFEQACQILGSEVSMRTSKHRATKEYRHMLLPVLLRKVLETAIARGREYS